MKLTEQNYWPAGDSRLDYEHEDAWMDEAERNWFGDYVTSHSKAYASAACAKIIVAHDVGEYADVRCAGGGATIIIFGDVGPYARVFCRGGGASIVIYGEVHPTATINVQGGAATVVLLDSQGRGPEPVTVGGGAKVFRR